MTASGYEDPVGATDGLGPWRSGEPMDVDPFPDSVLEQSVADRFFEMVQRHGDREALSSPSGTWTYEELGADVRRRAGDLVQRIGSDGRAVALLASHDGPLVVTLLAVVASGNVVVVVDPASPFDQQLHVLRESDAALVVHDDGHADLARELADRLDGTGLAVVQIDDLDAEPIEPVGRSARSAVMLAFTSGTSGEPKAAVITEGVLLNMARGATNTLGIGPDDRMPMLFPTSLAVAAYPLFLPLLNGGTLATLDVRSVGLEPVAEFLADERITLAYMAPTVVRFLVDALAGRSFPDLRLVALGGEQVDAEVIRLTDELFAPDHIAVGYGTTESGVVSLHVRPASAPAVGVVPCGHPVAEVEIVVLDDQGDELPVGASGEVAIASPHMFDGYLGHPDLSRRVLGDDPRGRPGWRLYRTGDIGRLDPSGELTVLGRLDTKVKIRGRMVVLGDVESDLQALEEVADAAVVAARRAGIDELVAYVVPASDAGRLEPTSIRSQLLQRRESFRTPARIVVLDELPQLPNGKVDRRALPDPDIGGGATAALDDDVADPARVELMRRIRAVWRTLLPADAVGFDDGFAELGGDSLLAAQMLVQLDRELGVTVPMGELVHARTIRELAAVVAKLRDEGVPSTVSMVQEGDAERPRLWFVHDLQGSAYRVRHLARHLGLDQPVWSFESPLLAGERDRCRSLEEFVAAYVSDMLAAQPHGPYWLAGYSFGGICAYEMARQLRAAGRQVAFVGVVDVGPGYRGPGWHARRSPLRPWFGVEKPPPPGAGSVDVLQHYVAMYRRSPKGAARHLMVRSGLARVVDPWRFRLDLARRGTVRPEWRLWYAWERHWQLAATAWDRANPYGGRVDLFWADETPSADATMGWGPLVAELWIHRFAGDHEGILEPRGARALAQVLRECIDERASA